MCSEMFPVHNDSDDFVRFSTALLCSTGHLAVDGRDSALWVTGNVVPNIAVYIQ